MSKSTKSTLPVTLILTALILAGLGVYFLTPKSIIQQIDLKNAKVRAYSDLDELLAKDSLANDSLKSLYSQAYTIASPHLLSYHTLIRQHHAWPYVGLNAFLGDSLTGENCQSWSNFKYLDIKMESTNSEGLYINLYSRVPEKLRHYPQEYLRMLQLPTSILTTPDSYKLELSKFSTPLWWKKARKIPLLDNENHLEYICSISVSQSVNFRKRPGADTLNIYEIKLIGESPPQFAIGISLLSLALLSLILPILKPRSFGVIQSSSAQPIEIINHDDSLKEKIQSYYEFNYMKQEDSAAHFAGEIGLHPKKLQEILRSDFKTTHKAWLNHLRSQEASRLLIQSDSNISEIADIVGFRTTTHFNRVFKEKTSFSPGDYRSQKRVT